MKKNEILLDICCTLYSDIVFTNDILYPWVERFRGGGWISTTRQRLFRKKDIRCENNYFRSFQASQSREISNLTGGGSGWLVMFSEILSPRKWKTLAQRRASVARRWPAAEPASSACSDLLRLRLYLSMCIHRPPSAEALQTSCLLLSVCGADRSSRRAIWLVSTVTWPAALTSCPRAHDLHALYSYVMTKQFGLTVCKLGARKGLMSPIQNKWIVVL